MNCQEEDIVCLFFVRESGVVFEQLDCKLYFYLCIFIA